MAASQGAVQRLLELLESLHHLKWTKEVTSWSDLFDGARVLIGNHILTIIHMTRREEILLPNNHGFYY